MTITIFNFFKPQETTQPRNPENAAKTSDLNTLKTQANVKASIISCVIDICPYHLSDTPIKRVQSGQPPFPHPFQLKYLAANVRSLCQGFWMAAFLKAINRSIRYGGESFIKNKLQATFPETHPTLLHIISGGFMGALNGVITSPLDTVKVKKQHTEYKDTSYWKLWKMDTGHRSMYMPITVARNILFTSTLMGLDSVIRTHVYQLPEHEPLSTSQRLINALVCPTIGLFVSYPADIIKTRMQVAKDPKTIKTIVKEIVATQGLTGMFNGAGKKTLINAPRNVLAFTIFQTIRDKIIETSLTKQENHTPQKMQGARV